MKIEHNIGLIVVNNVQMNMHGHMMVPQELITVHVLKTQFQIV